ncbi:hypothetical protein [Methanospirillum sp.]|uniref:hypothetical protein n=1 Tax=Methanospirillum sp. TaxID=45200 RepID=UPI002C3E8E76|nr:hypothetical protein [Methanospirillum sp.]HPP78451.1 hypothetical protein [Methanospirillum sp.]
MTAVSEGLEILHLISQRGGCLLSELVTEVNIPEKSIKSWISMWCSTGHLKRSRGESRGCGGRKGGMKCICCLCAYKEKNNSSESRVELTKRGHTLIRRNWDEKPYQK